MMDFDVKKNGKFMELAISDGAAPFESGLLNREEAIELANRLHLASEELIGDTDAPESIQGAFNRLSRLLEEIHPADGGSQEALEEARKIVERFV